jgi:hypothetical protein
MSSRNRSDSGPPREYARVVDEDVEPTQLLDGAVHGGHHRVGVGAVGPDSQSTASEPLDLGHHFLGAVGTADIGDGHVHAVACQPQCDGGTDTPAASGDRSD